MFFILISRQPLFTELSSECLFSRLRKKKTNRGGGGRDDRSEDALSSMSPDPTSNFCRGPCLLSFSLGFFFWAFGFEYIVFTTFHAMLGRNAFCNIYIESSFSHEFLNWFETLLFYFFLIHFKEKSINCRKYSIYVLK